MSPNARPASGHREHYYEGPPPEDQFDRQRRQDAELLAASEAVMAANRAKDQRAAEYREVKPRVEALRQMARQTIAFRGIESAATRRAALHRHPVYKSLPDPAQRAWDSLVDEWTETLSTGDLGSVWRAVGEMADVQASADTLTAWEPPAAESEDPAALAALIPRG